MSNHLKRVAERTVAEMHIRIMADGQTKVTGPLGNRKLCMAILDDAANVIKAFNPQTEDDEHNPSANIVVPESRIIVPN